MPDPIVDGESVVVLLPDDETVQMPVWYWKKVVRYMIDTQ